MLTYQPGASTATIMVGGTTVTATPVDLEEWGYGLLTGVVTVGVTPLANAGVEVTQIVAAVPTVLGVIFTDADGLYKVSVPVVTGATYTIDVYSPIA